MNLKRKVWLPPDGDPRLVRFQEELVQRTGRLEAGGLPPHLSCEPPGRVPVGPVRFGSWRWEEGVPVLEALDSQGPCGVFRFCLPSSRIWVEAERAALPTPPVDVWNRGRLAVLDLNLLEDGAGALWSWEALSGWRAEEPTV